MMLKHVVVMVLILVALVATVSAAENAQTQQARYISAELQREMDQMEEELKTELKNNNDENFRVFEGRMVEFMSDAQMKILLGGIGGILVANALVAIVMFRYFKSQSYEAFKDRFQHEQNQQYEQEMQQREWHPQQPQQSVGMQYGQEQAAQMSQMNQWQTQPAYAGSWTPPSETQSETEYPFAGWRQDNG